MSSLKASEESAWNHCIFSIKYQLTISLCLHGMLEDIADSKQTNLMPECGCILLADAEVPSATARIPGVLPKWLYASVEEVDRVSQFQVVDWNVVEVLVESFYGDDGVTELFGAGRVLLGASGSCFDRRCRLLTLFRPELPFETELGNAHLLEDVVEHSGASSRRCGCDGLLSRCGGQVRGAESGESAGHVDGVQVLN